jgi:hypothetical protein
MTGSAPSRGRATRFRPAFYRQLATLLKVLLRLVPTAVKAAIAATAINAAINAYSIAVTPDSSLISFIRVRNRILLGLKYNRAQLAMNALINRKNAEHLSEGGLAPLPRGQFASTRVEKA